VPLSGAGAEISHGRPGICKFAASRGSLHFHRFA
jgi:hypothetical protein